MKINSEKISKYLSISPDKIGLNLHLMDLKNRLTERQFIILKLKLKSYKNIEVAKKIKMCPATITKEVTKIKIVLREYVG